MLKDRHLFLDIIGIKEIKMNKLRDVVNFLQENDWCFGILPEYIRFIKLLLTIPGSSYTKEQSFSALRRLKNYLRSTMLQERLKNIAILHVYSHETIELNIK